MSMARMKPRPRPNALLVARVASSEVGQRDPLEKREQLLQAFTMVKGIEVTEQGRRDQDILRIEDRLDTRGNPYYWLGFKARSTNPEKGTDMWAVLGGSISVTPLCLNLTQAQWKTGVA